MMNFRFTKYFTQLSKFTNVVKGWQYRWFVLEPEAGRLEYHLLEDRLVLEKLTRNDKKRKLLSISLILS